MPEIRESLLSNGDRLERRLDPVAQRVRHATAPLFKPDGRREPQLVGCSVAVRRGEDIFLLSCRHVVVDLKMTDFHIYTPLGWVMAHGQIARTDPDKRGKEPFDAAVIALDRSVVNAHLRNNSLSVADLDVEEPDGPPNYLMQLVGYPGGEVIDVGNKTLSPTWFQWAGVGASLDAYPKRGRDPKYHTLFEFDRAQSLDREGERHPGPDMHGASGSGVWRFLPIGEDVKRERWALLNSIFTDYQGRMIGGTRVGIHLGLISKYFPSPGTSAS